MLISEAWAQAAGGAGGSDFLVQLFPLVLIFIVFCFFAIFFALVVTKLRFCACIWTFSAFWILPSLMSPELITMIVVA